MMNLNKVGILIDDTHTEDTITITFCRCLKRGAFHNGTNIQKVTLYNLSLIHQLSNNQLIIHKRLDQKVLDCFSHGTSRFQATKQVIQLRTIILPYINSLSPEVIKLHLTYFQEKNVNGYAIPGCQPYVCFIGIKLYVHLIDLQKLLFYNFDFYYVFII